MNDSSGKSGCVRCTGRPPLELCDKCMSELFRERFGEKSAQLSTTSLWLSRLRALTPTERVALVDEMSEGEAKMVLLRLVALEGVCTCEEPCPLIPSGSCANCGGSALGRQFRAPSIGPRSDR